MFKVNNKPRTYFTPCSSVSIVNFEQANADWCVGFSYISIGYKVEITFARYSALNYWLWLPEASQIKLNYWLWLP